MIRASHLGKCDSLMVNGQSVKNREEWDYTLLANEQMSVLLFYGRWQKAQVLWVRDKGLYHSEHRRQREPQVHVNSPSPTVPHGNLGGRCTRSRCALYLRNSKSKEPQSFTMGCKQTCPIFAPKETVSLLYWTANKSALYSIERHYLCLPRLFTI